MNVKVNSLVIFSHNILSRKEIAKFNTVVKGIVANRERQERYNSSLESKKKKKNWKPNIVRKWDNQNNNHTVESKWSQTIAQLIAEHNRKKEKPKYKREKQNNEKQSQYHTMIASRKAEQRGWIEKEN